MYVHCTVSKSLITHCLISFLPLFSWDSQADLKVIPIVWMGS